MVKIEARYESLRKEMLLWESRISVPYDEVLGYFEKVIELLQDALEINKTLEKGYKKINKLADEVYNITKDAKYGYNETCLLDNEDELEIFKAAREILRLTKLKDE